MDEHRIELPVGTDEALAAVGEAAEAWGAAFSREGPGGRVELPVAAGLRHGTVAARLWVEGARPGCTLVLRVEDRSYRLHRTALMILLFAASGAMTTVLWPFFPGLLPVAPVGAILALSAWFLVVSRLRVSGPREFLGLVEDLSLAPAAEDEPLAEEAAPAP